MEGQLYDTILYKGLVRQWILLSTAAPGSSRTDTKG